MKCTGGIMKEVRMKPSFVVGAELTRLKLILQSPKASGKNEPPHVGSYEDSENKKPLPVWPEGARCSKLN
jgi:hypothetical protein